MKRCWAEAATLAPPPTITTTVAATTRQKQLPWQRSGSSSSAMTRWVFRKLFIYLMSLCVPAYGIYFKCPSCRCLLSQLELQSTPSCRYWTQTWTSELFSTSSGATPPRTQCCFTDQSSESDHAVLGCHSSSCAVSRNELVADYFGHERYCYILLYKWKVFFSSRINVTLRYSLAKSLKSESYVEVIVTVQIHFHHYVFSYSHFCMYGPLRPWLLI